MPKVMSSNCLFNATKWSKTKDKSYNSHIWEAVLLIVLHLWQQVSVSTTKPWIISTARLHITGHLAGAVVSVAGRGRADCELRPAYVCQTALCVSGGDNPRRSGRGTVQRLNWRCIQLWHSSASCPDNGRLLLPILNKGETLTTIKQSNQRLSLFFFS